MINSFIRNDYENLIQHFDFSKCQSKEDITKDSSIYKNDAVSINKDPEIVYDNILRRNVLDFKGKSAISLREYGMLEDKLSITLLCYMDDWSVYANNNNQCIISCTQGYGYNILDNDCKAMLIEPYPTNYKLIYPNPSVEKFNGWTFISAVYDGIDAKLYINDNEPSIENISSISSKLNYTNNSVILGAEAYSGRNNVEGCFF